jgi:hypothetical protein
MALMRLPDNIASRIETIKTVYGRPWVLVLIGLFTFLSVLAQYYDLLQSQLLPGSWAKRAPRIFDMIEGLANLLSASTWAMLLMAVVTIVAIEYAVRANPKFIQVVWADLCKLLLNPVRHT